MSSLDTCALARPTGRSTAGVRAEAEAGVGHLTTVAALGSERIPSRAQRPGRHTMLPCPSDTSRARGDKSEPSAQAPVTTALLGGLPLTQNSPSKKMEANRKSPLPLPLVPGILLPGRVFAQPRAGREEGIDVGLGR